MTAFPAGPYILEIPYIVADEGHSLRVNCDVTGSPAIGSAPSSITLETKDGDGILLNGGADEFWDAVRPLMSSDASATAYILWRANEDNNDLTFISGGTLTTPNGASGGDPILTSQATYTWRSGRGNWGRIQIMDQPIPLLSKGPLLSTGQSVVNALSTYILGGTSFIMARDRSFLVVPLNASFDPQNQKLFNRRYRS
jgi:hypothetical protein